MEGEKKYPHMCGGVLASILLSHKKDKSPQGVADPLNKSNFIRDLARIVRPGFDFVTTGNPDPIVSYYVNCRRKTSSVLPFAQVKYKEAFKCQMEESYPLLLHRMDLFLNKYLDINDQYDRSTIIQEILSIAAHDSSCIGSWLAILPNGEKTRLAKLTDIHFQPFILGIWYYIISHNVPNVVESSVFDVWDSKHNRMNPRGDIILDIVPAVSEEKDLEEMVISDEEILSENGEGITDDDPVILDAPTEEEPAKDQTLISHNGRIYNQHAEKIVNIEHLDVLNL